MSQGEAQLPASAIPFPILYDLLRDAVSCMMTSCKPLTFPLLNEAGQCGIPLSPQPLEVGHREYYHGNKCAYGCVRVWGDVSGGI